MGIDESRRGGCRQSTCEKIKYSNRSDTLGSCRPADHCWSATQARLLAPHRLMNSSAPISGFVFPSTASRAICASCGVRASGASDVGLPTGSPAASSSRRARSANALAPKRCSMSEAIRRCSRASTRRLSPTQPLAVHLVGAGRDRQRSWCVPGSLRRPRRCRATRATGPARPGPSPWRWPSEQTDVRALFAFPLQWGTVNVACGDPETSTHHLMMLVR